MLMCRDMAKTMEDRSEEPSEAVSGALGPSEASSKPLVLQRGQSLVVRATMFYNRPVWLRCMLLCAQCENSGITFCHILWYMQDSFDVAVERCFITLNTKTLRAVALLLKWSALGPRQLWPDSGLLELVHKRLCILQGRDMREELFITQIDSMAQLAVSMYREQVSYRLQRRHMAAVLADLHSGTPFVRLSYKLCMASGSYPQSFIVRVPPWQVTTGCVI